MAELIYTTIPKVAKAIGAIAKDRKNEQQGYRFRGIDDVLNACHGPLTDNGMFVTTSVSNLIREERQGKSGGVLIYTTLQLEVTFWAEDGSSVTTVTYGEAMDSGDKSTNKAMSAALKYAFFQTFTIPLEEMDDADRLTPDPKPRTNAAASKDNEKAEFNRWAMQLVNSERIQPTQIKAIVDKHKGNYVAARQEIEKSLN